MTKDKLVGTREETIQKILENKATNLKSKAEKLDKFIITESKRKPDRQKQLEVVHNALLEAYAALLNRNSENNTNFEENTEKLYSEINHSINVLKRVLHVYKADRKDTRRHDIDPYIQVVRARHALQVTYMQFLTYLRENKPVLLKKVQQNIKRGCETSLEGGINVRRHYETLAEDTNLEETGHKSAVLVLWKDTVEDRLKHLRITGTGTDVEIQEVRRVNTGHVLSILPEGTGGLTGNGATRVSFTALKADDETLHTACKLFERDNLDFDTCLEIAQHI